MPSSEQWSLAAVVARVRWFGAAAPAVRTDIACSFIRSALLRTWLAAFALAAFLLLGVPFEAAQAHRLRPAVVNLTLLPAGAVNITIEANFEALVAGIAPRHQDTTESPQAAEYEALRALTPDALRARIDQFAPAYLRGVQLSFDGAPAVFEVAGVAVPSVDDLGRARVSTLRLRTRVPAAAGSFTWQYAAEYGDSVLRIQAGEGPPTTEWLVAGNTSRAFPLEARFRAPPSSWSVFVDYLPIGFTHIVPLGVDHILFVLGIFLLSTRAGPLLWQVTAFTVAHSITLSLALFGVVELSAAIVEPLIALSIVYVGVENLLTSTLKPWRVVVVFLFGLLHGMGFAGVLTEVGLPAGELVAALIAFNVGVELGQLSVIAIAFLVVAAIGAAFGAGPRAFATAPWYRPRVVIPASLAIAAVGLFWTVQRSLGL